MAGLRSWLMAVLGLALFLLGSYAVIRWVLPLILPFVLAALLAELINPVVDRLSSGRRLRLPRGLATLLVLLVLAGGLGFVTTLAVAKLVRELRALAMQLPYYYALAMDLARALAAEIGAYSETLPSSVTDLVSSALARLQNLLAENLPQVLHALQAFAGLPGLMINLLIVAVATFFISRDRRQIGRFLLGLLPPGTSDKVRRVKEEVWTAAMGVAKAQLFLISLTTALSILGLSLMKLEYAVTMGLLVGIADLLPVVGPGAVYLPWAVAAALTGKPALGVQLVLLYGLLVAVRQVLEPKLVGDQTGLHPLTTLFAMYLGFQFFGPFGVVLGPLVAILLKAMVQSGLLPIFPAADDER
ncbi:MAG: sporulation integral membrane protein YtvI [Bacillota bacterium]|nr:MAG: sporulation integral membrane protein YtvI [Bacillota bacterium]